MIKSSAQPEAWLGWMGSLADPMRLRLLRLLERQELGVVDLCDVVQSPQSTVSRHLKVLSDEGWVRSRRQGTAHLYRLLLDELDPPARRLWVLAREQTDDWSAVHQDELRLARRLRERDVETQAFFAGAAAEWDRLRDGLYGRSFSPAALVALLPREYVVADLGCGTGQMLAALAPVVKRVIGVDNSAPMLKAARKRVEAFGNVELRRAELEALPIEAGQCDAALLVLALTYVANPAVVLGEMARVLRPGGRGVVVDLLPHDREDFRRQMNQVHGGFDAAAVEQMMRAAGFAEASVRVLPPEPEAKGPALFLAVGTMGPAA